MITNQDVFTKGELMNSWPCDWDPANMCQETNFCVEAIYKYLNKQYSLFITFDGSEVYNPSFEAELIGGDHEHSIY